LKTTSQQIFTKPQNEEILSMSKLFNEELENKIISKINELYITNRKKYLILSKEGNTGKYIGIHEGQDKYVPLNDSLIRKHLRGKQTVGVFSGKNISKFLCFDLDIVDDKKKLKWTYYLLTECLNELGIKNEHIHVASSGFKGYHVLIFIENGTSLNLLISLFNFTMQKIKSKINDDIPFVPYSNKEHYGEFEFGKIEMRCTYTQGVKIELGINFNNSDAKTNKCVFLENDTLEPIHDDGYILWINPMEKDEFIEIMDNMCEKELISDEIVEMKSSLQEPHSHKINKDEDTTISHIINLINNGLHISGTRHNSCLKIAKYFRYSGYEIEDCIEKLKEWMMWQDKKYYSTPLNEALSECERVSRIVYEKEYQLFGNVEDIKIYKSELKEIIKIENKYDKLLLHTMLIHSKRYALKNGVFYMTYKQMKEMCGIGIDGSMASIERLEAIGLIEVVSRNVRQENNYKHLPNKYKININNVENDDVVLEIDNSSITIYNNELYYRSMLKAFTKEELKHLPNRQYREFNKLRNVLVG
jgi:hypothetical protein